MQNGLGVKNKLDLRELGIQFGCIRLIPLVQKALSLYRNRFLAALPASRRASANFTRPVFTAVAFYLCAKRHKLKIDKVKLLELCGTSESEFSSIAASMKDLCHDNFGVSKEKKDLCHDNFGKRDLPDDLPEKRRTEVDGYLSDAQEELSSDKKRQRTGKHAYEGWKSTLIVSNNHTNTTDSAKRSTRP